ncbi:hypothetical protein L873DRAFT_1785353 [Choiromyces venosus 120613-1]|uniref:Uncharacterized protein n=1 Tax=Choiromyces venosus 120613-1 TaxID=1336337 RepID=A0A3N4K5F1_9PEZI|nr:hypothetical protein L873DRAFT_1785353 [Choiromyces venosus 120613-1]
MESTDRDRNGGVPEGYCRLSNINESFLQLQCFTDVLPNWKNMTDGRSGNQTAISQGISFRHQACNSMYNVTFPPPTEVVKILSVSVPSGIVLPTTVSGVPFATGWPGDTSSSASPSASSSSSSNGSSGSAGGNTPNAGLKNAPSSLLTILCTLFAIGFFSIGVNADQDDNFDPYNPSCAMRCADQLANSSTTCTTSSSTNGYYSAAYYAYVCTDKPYLHDQIGCIIDECKYNTAFVVWKCSGDVRGHPHSQFHNARGRNLRQFLKHHHQCCCRVSDYNSPPVTGTSNPASVSGTGAPVGNAAGRNGVAVIGAFAAESDHFTL